MAVNLLDPVTPSGAQAAEGFRSNLVEKARLDMEHTRIATQAELQKAQIDAEVQMKQAEMKHNLLLQTERIGAEKGMQDQRLTAEQEIESKRLEEQAKAEKLVIDHNDKLIKEAREYQEKRELEEETKSRERLLILAQGDKTLNEEKTSLYGGIDRLQEEINAKMLLQQVNGKVPANFITDLTKVIEGDATAKSTAKKVTAEVVAKAAKSVFAKAALKEGGGRLEDVGPAMASWVGLNPHIRDTVFNNANQAAEAIVNEMSTELQKVMPHADMNAVREALAGMVQSSQAIADVRGMTDAEYEGNAKKYPETYGADRQSFVEEKAQRIKDSVDLLRKGGMIDVQIIGLLDGLSDVGQPTQDPAGQPEGTVKFGRVEAAQRAKSFEGVANIKSIVNDSLAIRKDKLRDIDESAYKGLVAAVTAMAEKSATLADMQAWMKKAGVDNETAATLLQAGQKYQYVETPNEIAKQIIALGGRKQELQTRLDMAKEQVNQRILERSAAVGSGRKRGEADTPPLIPMPRRR